MLTIWIIEGDFYMSFNPKQISTSTNVRGANTTKKGT